MFTRNRIRPGAAPAASLLALLLATAFAPGARAAGPSAAREAEELFSGKDIPRLHLEIADEEMEVLRGYKRKRGADRMERTNVLATVREGKTVYTNVAVHLKGSAGSFRSVDTKPALTLIFDKHDEAQRFHGLQKISLNNSVQDPTFLCERIGREMFTAAGLPVPRLTYATVELNGSDLGLFVLLEGWNKQFLKRHFRDASGNLYEGAIGSEITSPLEVKSGDDPDDRSALDRLAAAAQEPDLEKRWAALGRALDLDRFITGMAMEIMILHWDGYGQNKNNYRIFHDRASDRLVFLPHGMDQLFGMRNKRSDLGILPQMRGLVSAAVLETPEGRERYLACLSELHTNVFRVAALTNRVAEWSARLRPLLSGDPVALASHETQIPLLQDRIARRFLVVREQLAAASGLPLPFDENGAAAITTSWDWKRDAGVANFTRKDRRGEESLQISAYGSSNCVGSWRTTVFLEKGRYRFEGKAKIETMGLRTSQPLCAVGLRSSEGGSDAINAGALVWTDLVHEFTVPAARHVQLICEFRGTRGRVFFDPESLKLVRLANPGKPARSGGRGLKRE